MSEVDPLTLTRPELLMAMRRGFADLISDALEGAGGNVDAYTTQLTQEFGHYLTLVGAGDKTAERNLVHLRAQVLLIAVKNELIAVRETMDQIQVIVEQAAIFAAKILIAAAR